jgi:hypothetical protein
MSTIRTFIFITVMSAAVLLGAMAGAGQLVTGYLQQAQVTEVNSPVTTICRQVDIARPRGHQ